ncbi:DUF3145 domain-containing protein [Leucobacter sp. M11]|uniref:DUF3145 domain-containing protein n=1 Tax=Leucobacter sp. M11 TaxID=2993565 RepID=UPI002D7E687E|nr:DUF3145 domain-containing protein [Leucobacter sp. M11]MEB4616099.1 DUF3145 domain-containing protein [Leucobacter sp. M11]
MASETTSQLTTGVFFVHSCPKALAPHLEWALARAVGSSVSFDWTPQPILKGSVRAEFAWSGPVGTATAVASSVRGWEQLRFEISEDATASTDGGRWLHTPGLGIFHMQTDVAGNAVVSEDRLRYAMDLAGGDHQMLRQELRLVLGQAWDEELETFRQAGDGDGADVLWLHRAG